MKIDSGLTVLLILASIFSAQSAEPRAPGRPQITSCRSPEKETFTCWWEPGDDGGLHTTYALYYRLEGSDTVYECSDYKTAGPNSCFFNKNNTSVWVNYNITVVATNAVGSSVSEPAEVDVVYIVQPNTPESVMAVVIDSVHPPYARVFWEKPRSADTRSGWITLVYQLRVKQDKDEDWEEFDAGMQKYYNVFSLHSGQEYMVQVRCKPDHGFWSEWTSPVYVQMPDYMPKERNTWIIVVIFTVFIFFILIWIMSIKSNSLKHCLLPPVPGPKIKGFDQQLFKSGNSDDAFNTLVIPSFPPTSYKEIMVEYLEVCDDKDEQELISAAKEQASRSDCDSGRGSCDSRTLLMEKCSGQEEGGAQEAHWTSMMTDDGRDADLDMFSSPQLPHHDYFQEPRCLDDFHLSKDVVSVCQSHSRYVEVQTVEQENLLLLRPLADPEARGLERSDFSAGQNYSKVRDVTADNRLLLGRDLNDILYYPGDYCQCQSESQEVYLSEQICKSDGSVIFQELRLAGNGYVDSTLLSS